MGWMYAGGANWYNVIGRWALRVYQDFDVLDRTVYNYYIDRYVGLVHVLEGSGQGYPTLESAQEQAVRHYNNLIRAECKLT